MPHAELPVYSMSSSNHQQHYSVILTVEFVLAINDKKALPWPETGVPLYGVVLTWIGEWSTKQLNCPVQNGSLGSA